MKGKNIAIDIKKMRNAGESIKLAAKGFAYLEAAFRDIGRAMKPFFDFFQARLEYWKKLGLSPGEAQKRFEDELKNRDWVVYLFSAWYLHYRYQNMVLRGIQSLGEDHL